MGSTRQTGAPEWAATVRHPLRNNTDGCLVKKGWSNAQVLSTFTPWSLLALETDPLPTGCLSLQVGSVELALDHTPCLILHLRLEALGGCGGT